MKALVLSKGLTLYRLRLCLLRLVVAFSKAVIRLCPSGTIAKRL